MSLETFFNQLCQEHHATNIEFVQDDARCDSRPPVSRQAMSFDTRRQNPSFQSSCERLSVAPKCPSRSYSSDIPKCPSRSRSSDTLATLVRAERVIAASLVICEGERSLPDRPLSNRSRLQVPTLPLHDPHFVNSAELCLQYSRARVAKSA